MKKFAFLMGVLLMGCASLFAQVPANCGDIMLQGFYWDSYKSTKYGNTKWTTLETQVDEIAATFSMIWLPPSATQEYGGGMGYHPRQYSDQNSSWGTEDALISLLSKLNAKGCKPIADIVVNHKSGCNSATDLCNEFFDKHGAFPGDWSMVCSDDEYPGRGGKDTGENWNGARDLDHTNSKTRDMIKAYLKWLKDLGYKGWRYDVAKGFSGNYVGEYNTAAGAYFSVGEYWDGDYNRLTGWVNATGKKSAVFDFCLKYNGFNKGLQNGDYSALAGYGGGSGMIGDNTYKQYAVTFIDNHDTFEREDKTQQFNGDWEQANAYILAMPGIPCVYWPHWVKCKTAIQSMAKVRKAMGITNTSSATCEATSKYFKGTITGSTGVLICYIGSGWSDPAGYKKACSGNGWAYYTNKEVGPITPDPDIPITKTDITVKFTAPSSWTKCHIWAWDSNDNNLTNAGAWPGTTAMTKNSDGTYSYTVKDVPGTLNFLFNNGVSGGEQTADESTTTSSCWKAGSKNASNENKYDIIKNTSCNLDSSTPDDPVNPDKPKDSITLKVKASSLPWGDKCYLYTWDGGDLGEEVKYTGDWPGTAMTLSSDGYYTFTVNQSMVYAIFTNGNASGTLQTDDIQEITSSTCYEISNETHENMLGAVVYGAIETNCPPTAIDKTCTNSVFIYPNPTNSTATIVSDKEVSDVTVKNLSGMTVANFNSNQFDLSGLAPSLYLVDILFTNGEKAVQKIIKK